MLVLALVVAVVIPSPPDMYVTLQILGYLRGSGSTVIGVSRVVVIAGDSSSRPRPPAMKSFPARLATSEE